MDSAYDHIQEKNYPEDQDKKAAGESSSDAPPSDFNSEVQEAYRAISSSPWAARLGGFWQTAKKQVRLRPRPRPRPRPCPAQAIR